MFKEVKQRARTEEPKNSSVITHNCDRGESQTLTISLLNGGRGWGREEISTVVLHLSGRWLSGSPIIRIGKALRVNLLRSIQN